MKILIAGGTGLIGRPLTAALQADGHEVVVLTRHSAAVPLPSGVRSAAWDGRSAAGAWTGELPGAGAVINLAGASIGGGRWTAARKRVLLESRTQSTGAIVGAMAALDPPARPPVLVNASGIDYFGHHEGDEHLDESAPAGSSFLAGLCVEWEAAARRAEALGTRVVLMRTSLVMSREALAFRLLTMPFRLFAGGPLGSGTQWFNWIHLQDMVALYQLAVTNPDLRGPVNALAPDVRREREVAREIGRVLHRPSLLPAPAFALRLLLGEQADLLLHGRVAVPARAQAAGFTFRYPQLGEALTAELT